MVVRVRFVMAIALAAATVACADPNRSPIAQNSSSSEPPATTSPCPRAHMLDPCLTPAAPAGAEFRIDPSTVVVGQPVTFSGTKCPSGQVAGAAFPAMPPAAGALTTADASPDPGGSWSTTVSVADATPLGPTLAVASCADAGGRLLFVYAPVDVSVTTFREVRVDPHGAVGAGGTVTVSSVGGCPHPDVPTVSASVELVPPPGLSSTPSVAASSPDLGPAGEWSTTLTVPTTAAPGGYVLRVSCTSSRAYLAFYPDTPITITAAR